MCRGSFWGIRVSGVYWGLTGTLGSQGPEGYQRVLGGSWGCRGHLGVSGVYWGLAGTLGTQGPEGV